MNEFEKKVDAWIEDGAEVAALTFQQKLEPVELDPAHRIIYPPTYADIGYNIDTLADGTKVALIDSVGSQANRMEPLFVTNEDDPSKWLVPQVQVVLREEGGKKVCRPLLEMAHRAADAVVRSTKEFGERIENAFASLAREGDAWPLAVLAPTSLVFGVWDSRGTSAEKRPRLVRSVIRAWDVDELHAAAQFNSVWKELSETQQKELSKEAKSAKVDLSTVGFADSPAVFRKTKVRQWLEDRPNPAARVLGGVLVRGDILRDVTINLTALRGLRAKDENRTRELRRYLLSLALYAASADMDLYLREGCHLRIAEETAWREVPRRGEPTHLEMSFEDVARFAQQAAGPFRETWPHVFEEGFTFAFDEKEAKRLIRSAKSSEE